GICDRGVQVYLVVGIDVRKREPVVLRVQKGPVIGNGQVRVQTGDDVRTGAQVKLRKPVVVGIAGDEVARRNGQGGRLHDDKEGVVRPAAVLAEGRHKDPLLRAGNVL